MTPQDPHVEELEGNAPPQLKPGRLSVCPHCWGVNPQAERLCGRCGADMRLLLQESGGMRRTAAVQSPVPVRPRLSPVQRGLVLGFLVLLALAHLLGALQGLGRRPGAPLPQPLGSGLQVPLSAPE